MQIGELAKIAEVSAKAIRYYEEIGLLPEAPRTEGGYRRYSPEAVELLRFIRKAQNLGLTLSEIREMAEIRAGGNLPCEHLHALLREKIADLEERIREMVNLRDEMRKTLRNWNRQMKNGNVAVVCPHIEKRPDGKNSPKPSLKRQTVGRRKKTRKPTSSGQGENG
jgi:DNA-binding transcriptional MerR regulator